LAVAGIPLSLIATIPTHTGLLVVSTWTLNFISASLLFATYRYDYFDLTQLKLARVARFPSWAMMLIFVAMIVGIFLYWSR
jgi:phosphate/sulfate permease